MAGFIDGGSEIIVNGKQSPFLKIRDASTLNIIKLSRELGLTPASRLPTTTIQVPEKSVFDVLPFPNTKQLD
jgi:phage terminase small subunit